MAVRSRSQGFQRLCGLLCLFLTATVAPRPAAGADPPAEPCSLCWRGRPAAHCKSFLITELGIGTRFKSYAARQPFDDSDIYLVLSLGYMRNLDSRNAIGGTINVDTDLGLISITPRYRRWLSGVFAADASAGVIVAKVGTDGYSGGLPSPGFRTDLSLNFADIASLGGGMEVIPYRVIFQGTHHDVAWHMESRLGSYPAAVGAAGLVAAVGAFLIVFVSSSGWD